MVASKWTQGKETDRRRKIPKGRSWPRKRKLSAAKIVTFVPETVPDRETFRTKIFSLRVIRSRRSFISVHYNRIIDGAERYECNTFKKYHQLYQSRTHILLSVSFSFFHFLLPLFWNEQNKFKERRRSYLIPYVIFFFFLPAQIK